MGTSVADAKKNRERCVALAKKGLSAVAIAKKIGLHHATVWKHLLAAGIKPKSNRTTAPLADRERVEKLVRRLGAAGAAEKLGVSRQAVYLRLERWAEEPSLLKDGS